MKKTKPNWLFKALDQAARRVDKWSKSRKSCINYGKGYKP